MQRTEARIRRLNEIYCDPLAPNMCINRASSLDSMLKTSSKVKERIYTERKYDMQKKKKRKEKVDQNSSNF